MHRDPNAHRGLSASSPPGDEEMTSRTRMRMSRTTESLIAGKWRTVLAAITVGGALALTACGGGSGEGVAPPPSNTPPTVPPSPAPTRSEDRADHDPREHTRD